MKIRSFAWRIGPAVGDQGVAVVNAFAHVVVTEVNPLRALEAQMDGYVACSMEEAAPRGDLFITVTGNKSVIRREHFAAMKDGAIVCNSGHFNVELDIPALERMAVSKKVARPFVDEYRLKGGKH